jgi:hypothetical protein
MRDIIEKDENLQLIVTTEPSISGSGRTAQFKIVDVDGATYRQQFDIEEGEIQWISIPVQLVGGNIRVG